MADTRARKLSRAAAGGDQQAEARGLLERVRRGELARERLELAAYLGHAVARLAHGDRIFGAAAEAGLVDFEAWVRGLDQWPGALVRAALAAARCAQVEWIGTHSTASWEVTGVEAAIAAAETLVATPGKPGEDIARLAHDELPDFAYYAALAVMGDQTNGNPFRRSLCAILPNGESASQVAGTSAVREAIRDALIPWALA